jgi:L-asparagine transporter-like permease
MIGAALTALLGGNGSSGFFFAFSYWIFKETRDLRRGGSFRDGVEDALMVWLGYFYGPWWWPMLMLVCGAYLMAMGARRGLA